MTHPSLVRHSLCVSTLCLLLLAASVPAEDAHLFVYRVGDGVATLVKQGNPVFLDEYTTSGTLVRSIPLPSGTTQPLIASGTASSEGFLTLSTNGQYIILTGYAASLPSSTDLAASASATVPRVVGRVDGAGGINTSTALTDLSDGNNVRSAASVDGTAFWATGVGKSGISGVRYATLGGTTSINLASAFRNARQVNIFADQLYASSNNSNGFLGVGTVGTGLPTTAGQTATRLTGLSDTTSSGSYGFFFANLSGGGGYDTLYIADDNSGATPTGGIQKWSWVTNTWVKNGTMGTATDLYRGLTAVVNGTSVTIYSTRNGSKTGTGGGQLVTVTDSTGYNFAPTATPALLAAADPNKDFRGVAFAPSGCVPSQSVSTASANPTSVPDNGISTSTITVTIKDAAGNPFNGKTVSLVDSPLGASTITPASGTTNLNGQATFTVKSTSVGTVTYTATDTTDSVQVNQQPQVSFIASTVSASHSTVSANPTLLLANGVASSTVTVTLKDSGDVPVSGKTVTLAGNPNTSNIGPANGASDTNGVVTFTVTSTVAGTFTYTATDTTDGNLALLQTPQVTFTPGTPTADQSTIEADPTTVVAEVSSPSIVTVTLKDANGNVVSGKTVLLTLNPPGGSSISPSNATGTTNASGQAAFQVWSTVARTVVYTAKDTTDDVTVNGNAQVIFTPGPVSPSVSTVGASPSSVVADGLAPSTVTVTLTDVNHNAVSGKAVSLSGDPPTSIIGLPSGLSDANGQVMFAVTSTVAGTVTYSATDTTDGMSLDPTAEVAFTPGTPTAGQSTVNVSADLVVADGVATSTITVTLKDANGNVVSGKTVSLAGDPATSTISTGNATSDANGQVAFTVKSTVAGPVSYTATDTNDQVSLPAVQVTFIPGPVSTTQSTVSASPTWVAADGTTPSTITVTLLDAHSNPVSGKGVSLAGNPAGVSNINPPSATTGANGVATFAVTSSTMGSVTYTATDTTDNNVALNQTPQVTFTTTTKSDKLRVLLLVTLEKHISVSWTGDTTGKTAGDTSAEDWTVTTSTAGTVLEHNTLYASDDPTHGIVMKLQNTSDTGTNAIVNATVTDSGGFSLGSTAGADTFALTIQLGGNQPVTLTTSAQALTGTTTLAPGASQAQPVVVRATTPVSVSPGNANVPKTIFVQFTATPE